MAEKIIGISRELLIHPGETVADILDSRGITQQELAKRTGVTPAFVSGIVAGKKNISAQFANALEYALDVPKSFWLNLQAHYDAELVELNESNTITEEELKAKKALSGVIKYLRKEGRMPAKENKEESVFSLRKALQVSNLTNLKSIMPEGVFRRSTAVKTDPYVMGAWLRLCQISCENREAENRFRAEETEELISELKELMPLAENKIKTELQKVFSKHGIVFSVMEYFAGAPVNGYISRQENGTYRMVITLRGRVADIFWFSVFHELGHIYNGDVRKVGGYVDNGTNILKEEKADLFARNALIDPEAYNSFIENRNYSIESIRRFAKTQRVMPYTVIGRLQKEKRLKWSEYSNYKVQYNWDKWYGIGG